MRAFISIGLSLLALAHSPLVAAQTKQVIKTAKAEVTFPGDWKIKPYQIGKVRGQDVAITIDDAFTFKRMARCSDKTFGNAYKAIRSENDDFRLLVVEFLRHPVDASRKRSCILKSLGFPVRSVGWEDERLRATAELKMDGVWTKGVISASIWKSCHPEYNTIAIIAVGPASKPKRANALLAKVGLSRLPIDCSDMKFHLVCDRKNINCVFPDTQDDK